MNENEVIDNPDVKKKLEQVHQQLLMDEDFQTLRTAILQSLNPDKQHFLHDNDLDYIKEYQLPPKMEQQISDQYRHWVKKIPQQSKKSFFNRIFQSLSFENNFGLSLPNIGLVTAGLFLGVILTPQWEDFYSSGAKNNTYVKRTGLPYQSTIKQMSNAQTEAWLTDIEELLVKGKVSAVQQQIKATRLQLANSVSSLQKTAKQGDKKAQTFLAWMYEQGYQVKQDDQQAFNLYQLAATQGESFAQNKLAIMYQNGWGVKQDELQALHWFKQAAQQNYAEAQYNLAMLYEKGVQGKQQLQFAKQWLKKAAEQGYARAQFTLNQRVKSP